MQEVQHQATDVVSSWPLLRCVPISFPTGESFLLSFLQGSLVLSYAGDIFKMFAHTRFSFFLSQEHVHQFELWCDVW